MLFTDLSRGLAKVTLAVSFASMPRCMQPKHLEKLRPVVRLNLTPGATTTSSSYL